MKTRELIYTIDALERDMHVIVSETDYGKAAEIIDAAYSRWCNLDENPELQFDCCEEYICSQLTENGIGHIYTKSEPWESEDE